MNTSDPDYRRWADAQEETNKLLRRRADKGDDAPLRSFFGGIIKGEGTMDEFFRKFREYKADLEDLNDQYRVATSVGLLSNRSMYQLDADLKSAHLSVSEFKHVLDFAGTVNFSKFGGGMNQATDNFLQISRVMQSSGLTTSLQQLGLNYQEQNELLAISFDRQKDKFAIERGPDGLPRITQSLTDRMVELGKNIALNTDILGISREDQLRAIAQRNRDAETQYAYEHASSDGLKKFISSQGPLMDALNSNEFKRLSLGYTLNSEEMAKLRVQFKENTPEMMRVASEIARVSPDKQAQETTAVKLQTAIGHLQDSINNPRSANEMKNISRIQESSPEYGAGLVAGRQMAMNLQILNDLRKNDKGEIVKSLQEVIKEQADKGKNGLVAPGSETPTAGLTPGQRATVLTQEALSRAADAHALMSRGIEMLANDVLGSAKLGDKLVLGLRPEGAFGQQVQLRAAQDVEASISTFFQWILGEKTAGQMADSLKKLWNDTIGTAFEEAKKVWNSGNQRTDSRSIPNTEPPRAHASGTMGVWGELFHDFNPAGELHFLDGKEAVLTPPQLSGLMNKVTSDAIGTLQQSLATPIQNTPTAQIDEQHFVDIKQLLGQLNTLMSHLPGIADTMDKQYSALKSLNNDALQS